MKNKNRGTLILIIIFLSIFSILGIWGAVANFMGVNKEEIEILNTNHEFKFNGKLYFYDGDNEIGTYTCKTSDCDYATLTIDDKDYSLNSYDTENLKTTLIDNKYAFIDDGGIILYDVTKQRKISDYKAIKNYEIPLANNLYILQDVDGLWGVVKLGNVAATVINYEYDFIGCNKTLNENNELSVDLFAVKDTNGWKIINNNNIIQGKYYLNEIYDYNESYVITKSKDNFYYLNSIDGDQLFSYDFIKLDFISKYVEVINSSNQYYIVDPNTLQEVSRRYNIVSSDDVSSNVTLNGIEITINGILRETVSIQ